MYEAQKDVTFTSEKWNECVYVNCRLKKSAALLSDYKTVKLFN